MQMTGKDENNSEMVKARTCMDQGDWVGAIAHLTQCIAADDHYADAYKLRGKILLTLGDRQGAWNDMRKVLELCPEELDAISGDYTAEGKEQRGCKPFSVVNPFGL